MEKFTIIIRNQRGSILVEKELQPQAENLFLILENIDGKLEENFSFQVGWSLYFLEYKNDEFYITSPDYTKNPFTEKTEDLTLALWVQLEQTHLLRKVDRGGENIRFDDKIIALKGVIKQKEIYLQRTSDIEKGDSGWYIGSLDDTDEVEEYEAFYTYELLKLKVILLGGISVEDWEYNELFEVINEDYNKFFKLRDRKWRRRLIC